MSSQPNRIAGATLDAGWRGAALPEEAPAAARKERMSAERVYDALARLYEAERAGISRHRIAEDLGVTVGIVDEHIKSLRADSLVRMTIPGHFAPVDLIPEPRAISITMLPNGNTKLEIGEEMLNLTAQEMRHLQAMVGGAVQQYAGMMAVQELSYAVSKQARVLQNNAEAVRVLRKDAAKEKAKTNPRKDSPKVGHRQGSLLLEV